MTDTLTPSAPAQAKQKNPKRDSDDAADPIENSLREKFAFEAYRILVAAQVNENKYDDSQIKTWTWKFADAAIRGKKKLHREALSQSGIVIGPPPEPPMPIAEPLPPLEEVT